MISEGSQHGGGEIIGGGGKVYSTLFESHVGSSLWGYHQIL